MPPASEPRPLDGIRVLELGQLMAGPFAATILGYFGAEVIKVEPPGDGDPIRRWRLLDGDTSLWWRSLARNKRSVTIDLRRSEGQALARRLAARCDVLVENFRPGTLERWNLDPAELLVTHPGLVVVRVSGYGQTGPRASHPGFASVCEAFGGLRYVTGHPGEIPVRANLSLGDSLGGLHAALGALLALRHRDATGRGQLVDLGIFEAVFNMLEATIPERSRLGAVRQPSGTTITGVAPTNLYRCADGRDIVIGGTGDAIFRRLTTAVGRPELADDARFADNAGRVRHEPELDALLSAWAAQRDSSAALAELAAAAVPAAPVYSAADILDDPHYRARGLFEAVEIGGRSLELPAIPPRLSDTPGRTEWAGPELGADTDRVLGELLALEPEELAALRAAGVI